MRAYKSCIPVCMYTDVHAAPKTAARVRNLESWKVFAGPMFPVCACSAQPNKFLYCERGDFNMYTYSTYSDFHNDCLFFSRKKKFKFKFRSQSAPVRSLFSALGINIIVFVLKKRQSLWKSEYICVYVMCICSAGKVACLDCGSADETCMCVTLVESILFYT
jgi:hypothetical protein